MDTSPSPARAQSATQPQLRTVLLCDLVDSTAMVERLGDARSTELIRRHDRLVRQLLAEHGGRGIDKSDGFLALFDRPIQAVGFAIAYQRELRTLGNAEGVPLSARTGIHVGDVLLWDNTPEDVAAGAKPVEVEGLAKPVAARLMNLALPGQILLSGVAQSLGQRAQSELGPVAQRLRWQTHGRFHFRGVPAPMLVHEVGEAGIAPLRVPASTPKAWRDVPVWRRPLTLAVEALAVAVLTGAAVMFSFRADPAIAFRERDWVVVGELNNLTGDARFDGALEVALRTSLEQSRHVNLLPEVRVRDTLRRMDRAGDSTIDRATAAEVALREGARAVLMPTVAEVGGRLRFSVEVIDPANQITVYAESAESAVTDGPLESVADVAASVRERLGESLASVGESSAPLAQVTTSSLDALRAYSLGLEATAVGDIDRAMSFLGNALALDPSFALAHAATARLHLVRGDYAAMGASTRAALADPARLTERERLSVDAGLKLFELTPDVQQAWASLARMYPEYFQASNNEALLAWHANDLEAALAAAEQASSPRSVTRTTSVFITGVVLTALERPAEARQAFDEASAMGFAGFPHHAAALLVAEGDAPGALAALERGTYVSPTARLQAALMRQAIATEAGDAAGMAAARAMLDPSGVTGVRLTAARIAMDADAGSDTVGLVAAADEALASAISGIGQEREVAMFGAALAAYRLADRGALDEAARVLEALERPLAQPHRRLVDNMVAIARARIALDQGESARMAGLLAEYLGPDGLLLGSGLEARRLSMAGDDAAAHALWRSIAERRGRAYGEWGSDGLLLVENARLLREAAGQRSPRRPTAP